MDIHLTLVAGISQVVEQRLIGIRGYLFQKQIGNYSSNRFSLFRERPWG
jgi:hypothetical protein